MRRQCHKCPWKKGTNPHDIPHGYCPTRHRALAGTIAKPGEFDLTKIRIMACHESMPGKELPCVGWMAHQLGPGNNIVLRLAVLRGQIDAAFKLVGKQHERFEDTLPEG